MEEYEDALRATEERAEAEKEELRLESERKDAQVEWAQAGEDKWKAQADAAKTALKGVEKVRLELTLSHWWRIESCCTVSLSYSKYVPAVLFT